MFFGLLVSESRFQPRFPILSRIYKCLTVILTLRTWAVWKRNQRLSIIFPTLFVLVWIPGFVVTFMFVNSVVCQ